MVYLRIVTPAALAEKLNRCFFAEENQNKVAQPLLGAKGIWKNLVRLERHLKHGATMNDEWCWLVVEARRPPLQARNVYVVGKRTEGATRQVAYESYAEYSRFTTSSWAVHDLHIQLYMWLTETVFRPLKLLWPTKKWATIYVWLCFHSWCDNAAELETTTMAAEKRALPPLKEFQCFENDATFKVSLRL